MLSMAVQSSFACASLCISSPSQKHSFTQLKTTSILSRQKPNLIKSRVVLNQMGKPISRNQRIIALAAPETLAADTATETTQTPQEPPLTQGFEESSKVVVKQEEKPRLVLKFIWMEKNIGLALDQQVPGHGTIPLSPYFFWPRKDAWEELKSTLENKPWISQKKMIILLNQATDIINLWQQSGGNLTSQ